MRRMAAESEARRRDGPEGSADGSSLPDSRLLEAPTAAGYADIVADLNIRLAEEAGSGRAGNSKPGVKTVLEVAGIETEAN